MAGPQFDLSGLQSGAERREAGFLLANNLVAKVVLDTSRNFVMVESTTDDLTANRTAALAKSVNDKNLQDSAGGYIFKDGKLYYRTSSLFVKGEFPEAVIRQMLELHQDNKIKTNLEHIKRESERS